MVEEREIIQPIVLIKNDGIVGMALTSHKTAQKSLETGVLWEIHSQTNSEVEVHPRIPIISLRKKNRGYIAEVDKTCADTLLEKAFHLSVEMAVEMPIEMVVEATVETASETDEKRVPSIMPEDTNSSGATSDILSQLQSIIISRKATLPEGSYTTHLFQQGKEKIRKKLGEEAIELILSPDKKSMVSESADLLYHLLVLLVDEDIDTETVLAELMRRHKKNNINK